MTVEERLVRLERENRWMRRAGAVVLAAASFVLLAAQGKEASPADVEVGSLTLKDEAGRARAALRMEEGAPFLVFWDERGKERVVLGGLLSSGLSLKDKNGRGRVELNVIHDGTPGITLNDATGRFRVNIGVVGHPPHDWPIVALYDAAGKQRAHMSVADGSPKLVISDREQRVRAALGVISANLEEQTPENSLVLFDAEGKVTWQAPK